mmetsp:Transcript_10445/g.24218  ORF Transcript_10445/g.24218 Transcript_10445/m.24218 type:complete len:102 (+) Transcript_10445:282-587(+)
MTDKHIDLHSWVCTEELTVSRNFLTGTIPSAPANDLSMVGGGDSSAIRLRRVDVSFNRLTGTIPHLVAAVPSITYINMAGNQLSGVFPSAPGVDFWQSIGE